MTWKIVIVCAVALVFRLVLFAVSYGYDPAFIAEPDTVSYFQWEAHRPVGYPLYLLLMGHSPMFAIAGQMVMSVAAVWVIAHYAGSLAGLALALDPLHGQYAGILLTETMAALIIAVMAVQIRRKNWKVAGPLLALSTLVRSITLYAPLVLAPLTRSRKAAAWLLVPSLAVLPLTLCPALLIQEENAHKPRPIIERVMSIPGAMLGGSIHAAFAYGSEFERSVRRITVPLMALLWGFALWRGDRLNLAFVFYMVLLPCAAGIGYARYRMPVMPILCMEALGRKASA
jgi:hypothetical protein